LLLDVHALILVLLLWLQLLHHLLRLGLLLHDLLLSSLSHRLCRGLWGHLVCLLPNIDYKFPLWAGEQPQKLLCKPYHQVMVLAAIVPAVQDHHNPTHVRRGHRYAHHGLYPPLLGSSNSFEVVQGCIVHRLLPGGYSHMIHPSRQAAPHVERKALEIVAKGRQVELIVARKWHRTPGHSAPSHNL